MPEKYCRSCGSELKSELKFCEKCGTATVAEAPTAAKPAVETQASSPLKTVKGTAGAATSQPVRGVVEDGDAVGRPVKKRSHVWIYWAVIAIACAVVGFSSTPWLLLAALGAAAYSFYIFRGGSWVFWIGP